jgi:crossover junction endodeoxyribonuclease RusA
VKTITFFVPGTHVPKGSARAYVNRYTGRAAVVQDNADRQRPWASLISLMAQEAGLRPVDGGVALTLTFNMPRPKYHFKPDGSLKPSFRALAHTKRPDIDKLAMCVLDALTGVAYADDSQVVKFNAWKWYTTGDVGCLIEVEG